MSTYDSFESLPPRIQDRITTLIAPRDAESWVKTRVEALGQRTFLDVINEDGGEEEVAKYFDQVEAFERPAHDAEPEGLGRIFHYDEVDFDSNRAGLLSNSQRSRLWRQEVLKIVAAAACLVGGTAFNIALVGGWMHANARGRILGLGLWAVGLVLAVWSMEIWLDLAAGTVLVAEGDLKATERMSSGRYGPSITYLFEINGQTFPVSKEAHDRLREGKRRLYYLRRSGTILSLDPP